MGSRDRSSPTPTRRSCQVASRSRHRRGSRSKDLRRCTASAGRWAGLQVAPFADGPGQFFNSLDGNSSPEPPMRPSQVPPRTSSRPASKASSRSEWQSNRAWLSDGWPSRVRGVETRGGDGVVPCAGRSSRTPPPPRTAGRTATNRARRFHGALCCRPILGPGERQLDDRERLLQRVVTRVDRYLQLCGS